MLLTNSIFLYYNCDCGYSPARRRRMVSEVDSPGQPTGGAHVIPFLARIGGVKDYNVYHSEEIGSKGRHALTTSGWHHLVVPACLAIGVTVIGYLVLGAAGLCFGLLFFLANAWIQSIANPLISERRAMKRSTALPAFVVLIPFLLSGTFAATLTAWYLFKPTVDQRHFDSVAIVMSGSQEKRNLDSAEKALQTERTNLANKSQVGISAVDQAAKAYAQAQDTVAKANAAYNDEVSKGQGGRRPGDGPAAKALKESLQAAQASEASAKQALDEARAQAAVSSPESANLVDDYKTAKEKYEAKEKSLIDAGPGLLKTFWWLLGMLHTEPVLIVFLVVWTTLEASGVISHSFAGTNAYEEARYTAIKTELVLHREARELERVHHKELAVHKAEMIASKKTAKALTFEAKDRTRR